MFSLTPDKLISQTFWVGEQWFGPRRYGKNRADWVNPNKDRRDRDCIASSLRPKGAGKGRNQDAVVLAVTGDTPVARVADLLSAVHEAGTREVWLAFGSKNVASLPAPADPEFHARFHRQYASKDAEAAKQAITDEMEENLTGCKATKLIWVEVNFGVMNERLFPAVIEEMLIPALKECRCPKSVDRLLTLILLLQEPLCHFVGRKVILDPSQPGLRAKGVALWRDVASTAIRRDASTFWITVE